MDFTPDGKYFYTTGGLVGELPVIDMANLKVIKSISAGSLSLGVVIGINVAH